MSLCYGGEIIWLDRFMEPPEKAYKVDIIIAVFFLLKLLSATCSHLFNFVGPKKFRWSQKALAFDSGYQHLQPMTLDKILSLCISFGNFCNIP